MKKQQQTSDFKKGEREREKKPYNKSTAPLRANTVINMGTTTGTLKLSGKTLRPSGETFS